MKLMIDIPNEWFDQMVREEFTKVDELCAIIQHSVAIPSATGHWIYDRTRDWDGECKYECSECGMGSDVNYPYCMRCGAKMVEPQERSEE